MNRNELSVVLSREGIRSDAYDLSGGCGDERYCLEVSQGVWSVYYSERGIQSGRRDFASESDACEYLFQILKNDPSTRT